MPGAPAAPPFGGPPIVPPPVHAMPPAAPAPSGDASASLGYALCQPFCQKCYNNRNRVKLSLELSLDLLSALSCMPLLLSNEKGNDCIPGAAAAASAPPLPSHLPSLAQQPGFQPGLAAVTEAQKNAKYAASALGFEDVQSAIKFLSKSLQLLTQPGPNDAVMR